MIKTRIEYVAGLFRMLINDKEKSVKVVGPSRRGPSSQRMLTGEVDNLRQWAVDRATNKFGVLGYSITTASAS